MCMYVHDLSKEICGAIKLIISAIWLVLLFTSFVALEFENALSICAISGLIQGEFR